MPTSRAGNRKRRSTQRKRSPATQPEDEWYSIREIKDEKTVKGIIYYLVDWEDNSQTGEHYSPTWVRILGAIASVFCAARTDAQWKIEQRSYRSCAS